MIRQKKQISILSSVILLLSLCFTNNIIAQTEVISIDDAINYALKNNKDISIARLNVAKSEAAVDEAYGYALPRLDLSAGFSHFIKKPLVPFPDFGALLKNATYGILFDENVLPRNEDKFVPVNSVLQSFSRSNNYQTELTLTQTLFSSAVFKGIGASGTYYNLARAELNNQVSKTVLSVQKSFYNVLIAREISEITKSSFQNAQENLANVKALFDQGMVSEFDYLQAEVRVENIRPVLLQMENMLKSSKDALKIVIGFDQQKEIELQGNFDYSPIVINDEEALINEALQSNFDLKSLDLKKQVDEAFIELDISEYWPTIAAFGNYSYSGSSETWDFQNYSSMTVGLNFAINLWQGNRTKNAVEQSTITFRQTEEQLQQAKEYTILNVNSKLLELKRVWELVTVQGKTVEVAERAYNIAKVRYKEGAGSQLELQNADQELKQARLNQVQSKYSYLITKFELEQLLGRTNPEYFSYFSELND
ncbi:MAG: TolC family protein [Ignavibacteriales bacterium]|nr:TolC family protein [Ignavibacteriales bacterium]